MDLSTSYLGFELPHPLIPGASPLADDIDTVRRLEDAGAPAIVLRSLFEEQLTREQLAANRHLDQAAGFDPEAQEYLVAPDEFALGPEEYLRQVQLIRETVAVPVIGSLNGVTPGGWLDYARLIVDAGAHALELNVYDVPTDPNLDSATLEGRLLDLVSRVTGEVAVPVAIKLGANYTAPAHLAQRLAHAGARGVVLFNRFYQADIDPEALEARPVLHLSTSAELTLRLTWLAILSGTVNLSLAVTGGVHTPLDAIKAVMAGAHGVQLVSALLEEGPQYLAVLRDGMAEWLEEHEYGSLAEMRGSMNLLRCPDPEAYERGNYMKMLQRL